MSYIYNILCPLPQILSVNSPQCHHVTRTRGDTTGIIVIFIDYSTAFQENMGWGPRADNTTIVQAGGMSGKLGSAAGSEEPWQDTAVALSWHVS